MGTVDFSGLKLKLCHNIAALVFIYSNCSLTLKYTKKKFIFHSSAFNFCYQQFNFIWILLLQKQRKKLIENNIYNIDLFILVNLIVIRYNQMRIF